MRISGPERYKLIFDPVAFHVAPGSSGIATSKKPKLYVVSFDGKPVYVGTTKQSLHNRLSLGWRAQGEHGYHGYAFRRVGSKAFLEVWCDEDAQQDKPMLDIETLEAEVVFLIRCAGQWPLHQTEIHFHPSGPLHRQAASVVVAHHALGLSGPH